MEVIRSFKGAKNAKVQLVRYHGEEWVYKKESVLSTVSEIKFQELLNRLGLNSLETISPQDFDSDELLQEYLGEGTLDMSGLNNHYQRFGETLAKLHDKEFSAPSKLDEAGVEHSMDWEISLSTIINTGINAITRVASQGEATNVKNYLESYFANHAPTFTYVHGDMHSANVLVSGDNITLFDKSDQMWRFSPYYDLAVLALNLANCTLIEIDDPEYKGDKELWNAFLEGYGEIDDDTFKHYCVLVAGQRLTNSHEPYNLSIVRGLAC